jgi:TIR domain
MTTLHYVRFTNDERRPRRGKKGIHPMPEAVPEGYIKPFVFISYASEDQAIASVIDDALKELDYSLDIFRDAHNLERGLSLTDQIYDALEKADFLLIIYTERLKKSHSFTGVEVGAFRMSERGDARSGTKKERRVVPIYLDEMPPVEKSVLGIELVTAALSITDPDAQAQAIDPDNQLAKLLCEISEVALSRRFSLIPKETDEKKLRKQMEDQVSIRNSKREKIDKTIAPVLTKGLSKALSSIVSKSSLEQRFLIINWPAPLAAKEVAEAVLQGTLLTAEDDTVFKLFIPDYDKGTIQYEDLSARVLQKHPHSGPFVLGAITEAARDALSSGPTKSDQFFLAPDKNVYRVVVSRHFSYYDGSRVMHMYFVPFLNRVSNDPILDVVSLLRVAVTYRMLFLSKRSDVSVAAFKRVRRDFTKVREKIDKFVRQFFLIQHESHVYELDTEDRYEEIYGRRLPPDGVADLFAAWQQRRDNLLSIAGEVRSTPISSSEGKAVTDKWIKELEAFFKYIEPLNKAVGIGAADRLKFWLAKGKLPRPVEK